jgi:hypothetical protein
VLYAPRDQRSHTPGQRGGRCRAGAVAGGKGSLPLSQYFPDIGLLSGQTGPLGSLAEQEVDLRAEMADRPATEGDRFARDSAYFSVFDPFVGQLSGQPCAPNLVGVERDIAQRTGAVACPHEANTDAARRGSGLGN